MGSGTFVAEGKGKERSGSLLTAIFPLITGVVSTLEGVSTLTYITVGLAGILSIMWIFFPSHMKT